MAVGDGSGALRLKILLLSWTIRVLTALSVLIVGSLVAFMVWSNVWCPDSGNDAERT